MLPHTLRLTHTTTLILCFISLVFLWMFKRAEPVPCDIEKVGGLIVHNGLRYCRTLGLTAF